MPHRHVANFARAEPHSRLKFPPPSYGTPRKAMSASSRRRSVQRGDRQKVGIPTDGMFSFSRSRSPVPHLVAMFIDSRSRSRGHEYAEYFSPSDSSQGRYIMFSNE